MKNKVVRITARIMLAVIVILNISMLSGCGKIKWGLQVETIAERFEDTLEKAEALYNSNVISEEQYNAICKNVNTLVELVSSFGTETLEAKDLEDKLTQDNFNLKKAITAFRIPYGIAELEGDNTVTLHGTVKINDTNWSKFRDAITGDYRCGTIGGYIYEDGDFFNQDLPTWNASTDTDFMNWRDSVQNGEWMLRVGALGDSEKSDVQWFGFEISNSFYAYKGDFDNDKIEPIKMIPDDVTESVNNALGSALYILRPDIDTTNFESVISDIKEILNKAKGGAIMGKDDMAKLTKYFYPANDTHNELTLAKILGFGDGQMDIKDLLSDTKLPDKDTKDNEYGYDIVVTQTPDGNSTEIESSNNFPSIAFRINEFNAELCDKINKSTGLFNVAKEAESQNAGGRTRYLKVDFEDGNDISSAMFLMEYPVSAIKGFVSTDNDSYKATYTDARIGLNIIDNRVIKYDRNTSTPSGDIGNAGKYVNTGTQGYIVSSALGNTSDENKSSFVIIGYTDIPLGMNVAVVGTDPEEPETISHAKGPRIVLKDYLEAAFTPGLDKEDNIDVTVLGRKIKFSTADNSGKSYIKESKNNWTYYSNAGDTIYLYTRDLVYSRSNNTVAYYSTFEGGHENQNLSLSDFCDLNALCGSPNVVKMIRPTNANSDSTGYKAVDKANWKSDNPDITELEHKYVTQIECTAMFPSTKIASADYDNDNTDEMSSRQRFWMIAVSTSMFNNGLYPTWIKSTDETRDSLVWWNDYLNKNKFKYKIGYSEVTGYLITGYEYQAGDDIAIDLDTIGKIHDILQKEDDEQTVKNIRTIFILIGWLLTTFSVVLMILWIIDTNTDLGLNLLTKATFGHWVAVKYPEDIPGDITTNTKYMTGQKVMIRCIIIMAVGLFLVVFNVLDLVSWLIGMFGQLAGTIEKLIRGIR